MQYAFQFNPEYIGFVDSDDFVDSTMYKKLYTQAQHTHADIAYCNTLLYNSATQEGKYWKHTLPSPQGIFSAQEHSENIFQFKPSSAWNSIYSLTLIISHSLTFPNCIYEDIPWFISSFVSADKITHVDETLYVYRQNRQDSIIYDMMRSTYAVQISSLYISYTYSMQWLARHDYVIRYHKSFHIFMESLLYSITKQKTFEEQFHILSYIQALYPSPLYLALKKRIQRNILLQKLFSLRNEYTPQKQKVLYILGIRIPLTRKVPTS